MRCCDRIEKLCVPFDSCSDTVILPIVSPSTGIITLVSEFNHSIIRRNVEVVSGEKIQVPNIFNENYEQLFWFMNPDGTMLNQTCFLLSTTPTTNPDFSHDEDDGGDGGGGEPFPQYQLLNEKGQPGGYAPLGDDGLVPEQFLPESGGTVKTVNDIPPDIDGNVELTPDDVGAIPNKTIYVQPSKVGMYYVSRQFSGVANAFFATENGLPVSDNSSYNLQLSKAKQGDLNFPFPDPYSAKSKAVSDIIAGTITRAIIIMDKGNRWTIGSNIASQNGGNDANPSTPEVADIQFSSTGNQRQPNLLVNNVQFHFEESSGFDYINKTFATYAGYISNNTSTTKSVFAITGEGIFRQVYGTFNRLIFVDDPNSQIVFNTRKLIMNGGVILQVFNCGSFEFLHHEIVGTEFQLFDLKSSILSQATLFSLQSYNIQIGNVTSSNILDYGIFNSGTGTTLLRMRELKIPTKIDMKIGNFLMPQSSSALMAWGQSAGADSICTNVEIDNFHYSANAGNAERNQIVLTPANFNSNFNLRIKTCYTECPLIKYYGSYQNPSANTSLNVKVDNCIYNMKNQTVNTALIYNVTQHSVAHTNMILQVEGLFHCINGNMYWENLNGTINGGTVLFKNCVVECPSTNTAVMFTKGSGDKCLMLDSVHIKCPNGQSFVNLVGGTVPVFITSVSTTDSLPNSNITFDGDTLKIIPDGYLK